MRKRRTGGGAAAASAATLAVGFLILQALVGRAHACSVAITNNYNVSLSFYSFNGYDNICTVPYQVGSVPPGYESNCTLIGCSSRWAGRHIPSRRTGCVHLSHT